MKKCLTCKQEESGCRCSVFDKFSRDWITVKAKEVLSDYQPGVLTIRGLHYQLVSLGMINTQRHYKRVVGAMIKARREGLIGYHYFSDHDRETLGETSYEETSIEDAVEMGKSRIKLWMEYYRKNRWENQNYYPEVFIEKKALQGVFEPVCNQWDLALNPCKGYPSLTFLKDAADRFEEAIDEGKEPIILYFGDYDPSGEDIPRSIADNLYKDFGVQVEMRRVLLMKDQVIKMGLPPAPSKTTDSRNNNWDGLGQVELDAVRPEVITEILRDAIEEIFDRDLHDELKQTEAEETVEYQAELKEFVQSL